MASITVLLASAYVAVGTWWSRQQVETDYRRTVRLVAATLTANLREAVFAHELDGMKLALNEGLAESPDAVYAFVSDRAGRPLAHTFSQHIPGDLTRLAGVHATGGGGEAHWTLGSASGDILHVALPIERGHFGAGYLHLGMSFRPVDERLDSLLFHLGSVMLLGVLLAGLGAALAYRRLARPISALTAAAAQVGDGNLTFRVAAPSRIEDEVALLAWAFNDMAARIESQVAELRVSSLALSDEKTRFRAILEGMIHGVVFYSPDGRLSYANSAARAHWRGVVPVEAATAHADHPEVAQMLRGALEGDEVARRARVRVGSSDLVIHVYSVQRADHEPLGVVEISEDITDQVESARALAEAEKLNVVGQLAAGVAHEINSPLDGAIEVARLLEAGASDPTRTARFARAQKAALQRIAAIIRRLLTYSRRGAPAREAVLLDVVITEAVGLIRHRLERGGIQLALPKAGQADQIIEGDALGLGQVIVNLLSNAIDASTDGGEIRIEVEETQRKIAVRVCDQGPGISTHNASQVFNPFFTTKAVGQGTGLGLAVSRKIISEHGGSFDFVNGPPPWGACFTFRLPWDGTRRASNEAA